MRVKVSMPCSSVKSTTNESEFLTFVDKVKELVKEQQEEVERAVIGRG